MNQKSPAQELNELLALGKKSRLWADPTGFGQAIGLSSSTIHRHLDNDVQADLIRPSVDAARAFIEKHGSDKRTVGDLFQEGLNRQLWESNTDCAGKIGSDRGTLSNYVRDDLPEAELTPGQIRTVIRLRAELRKLVDKEVKKKCQPTEVSAGPSAGNGVPIDQVIRGDTVFRDQIVGGLLFILTKDNFRPITGSLTDTELADTVELIRELRRRLNIISQATDPDTRTRCYHALSLELDELHRAYEIVSAVVPTNAAANMERDRNLNRNLHRNKED
jgi:hypothetical protein